MSKPEFSRTISLRDKEATLCAFNAEQLIEWLELTTECGKVAARVVGAADVNPTDIRNLVWAGAVLAGMALGDQELAFSLTEGERQEIIAAQDELNRSQVLVTLCSTDKAAAKAYLHG
ncbi:MAG: hypothetical protein WC314_19900 [Vulcanimicrobiota bacterium]